MGNSSLKKKQSFTQISPHKKKVTMFMVKMISTRWSSNVQYLEMEVSGEKGWETLAFNSASDNTKTHS